MLLAALLILMVAGTGLAVVNWRYGLLAAYLVGLFQDPVRKAMPSQPSIMILCFVPIYVAMVVGLMRQRGALTRVFREFTYLRRGLLVLLVVCAFGSVITVSYYGLGTLPLVALGLMSYFGGVPALAIGFSATRDASQMRRLLAVAAIMSAVFSIGGGVEYLGYKWDVLGTLNRQDWLHHYGWGKQVRMICGFFRSPEMLGWHGAMVTMVALTMLLTAQNRVSGALWLIPGGWGLVCSLLSGRRKMIFMVLVFVGVLTVRFFRQRQSNVGIVFALAVLLVLMLAQYYVSQMDVANSYMELAQTTFTNAASDRLESSGYDTLTETIRQTGFFGYGLGTVSQGSQYLQVDRPKTWQEGGFGKIAGELGVPGLLAFVYLGLVLVGCFFQSLQASSRTPTLELLASCLFAMLVANAACFFVAQQLYGDPFILFLVGLLMGMLMSMTRLARGAALPRPRVATALHPAW